MHYWRDGEWRQIARVTGPRHNMLGLVLSDEPFARIPDIEAAGETLANNGVSPASVLREVDRGLAGANTEFGTHYRARRIRFVADDTPAEGVYELLAHEIVRNAVAEEAGRSERLAAG